MTGLTGGISWKDKISNTAEATATSFWQSINIKHWDRWDLVEILVKPTIDRSKFQPKKISCIQLEVQGFVRDTFHDVPSETGTTIHLLVH